MCRPAIVTQIAANRNRIIAIACSTDKAKRSPGLLFISRKGAKVAKNFYFNFGSYPNTFAYFAPWRELIVFSLAEAQRPQRTSMFILFSPQTPLRTLRLGES